MTTTLTKIKQEIINEIYTHISKSGHYSDWYIGIAKDPQTRLFNDHNVSKDNGWWIYRQTSNSSIAREIESFFLAKGCKGGDGGGDYSTDCVYAYKISHLTKQ